jgi:hypothetical protein
LGLVCFEEKNFNIYYLLTRNYIVTSVTSEPIVPRGRNPTLNNATDKQSIWKAQIQELWAGVEGAQVNIFYLIEIFKILSFLILFMTLIFL